MHLMPLSVWGKPPACVYWVADVIWDTPLLRWKVKYYKALCVLTILLQIGSRNVCLHNCHCFQILNKHCNMLCVHCIVKFIKVKIWGGGMIIWNYVVGRLNDIHSIWIALYLYTYFRKISLLNSQGTFYLWIQRFLMKQIPYKNEVMLLNLQKKLLQEVYILLFLLSPLV